MVLNTIPIIEKEKANEYKSVRLFNYKERQALNKKVYEYARTFNLNIGHAWHNVYDVMKNKYGIDIPMRVARAKARLQVERLKADLPPYSSMSTLDRLVNGLDILFQEGLEKECLKVVEELIDSSLLVNQANQAGEIRG